MGTMEIVGLAAALAALGGALLWDQGTQRRHVQRACARWEGAGNTVQAGPIGTIAEGDLLEGLPLRRAFGALAAVNGQVHFVGHPPASVALGGHTDARQNGLESPHLYT
jgi:hypothetical protein